MISFTLIILKDPELLQSINDYTSQKISWPAVGKIKDYKTSWFSKNVHTDKEIDVETARAFPLKRCSWEELEDTLKTLESSHALIVKEGNIIDVDLFPDLIFNTIGVDDIMNYSLIAHLLDKKERYYRVANGMADSILRGSGEFGAMLGTTKNVILKIAEREGFDEKAIEEIFNLSPPIGTKTRKLFDIKDKFTYKQELAKMREMGVDTENPAVLAAGDALSFGLNLPADRALRKINNLRAAYDKENETWQRIALSLGWSKWDVGIPFESASKSNMKTKKLTTKKLK